MTSQQATDLLIAIQALIALVISARALYLYRVSRSTMLFSLGLSMAVIAIGGISGLINDFGLISQGFNTLWFRYIGQTVSYCFILLISLPRNEHSLVMITRWHLLATALLLILLVLSPVIPTTSSPLLNEVLSGSRAVVCLVIFFRYYLLMYERKGTRFSFLMCLAFFLITVGIAIYTMKFSMADPLPDDYVGDGTRLVGLVVMLVAFFAS